MEKAMIEHIKKEMDKLDIENGRLNKIIEMQKNPIVQKYMNLTKDEINHDIYKILSTEEMIKKIIGDDFCVQNENDNIYFYLTSRMKDGSVGSYKLYKTQAEYVRIFRNLEEKHNICVFASSCDYFEKTYSVIYPFDYMDVNSNEHYDPMKEYYNVQADFIKEVIENGSETAKKIIMKRYHN